MNGMSSLEMDTPIMQPKRAEDEEEIRAALYIRTSSMKNPNGYSPQEQFNICWQRCEMLGWTVTHVFRDIDESGKTTDRPKFQKLMESADRGLFDVVVFWKLDRFSRTLMHAVKLESELRENNVALHSVTEYIDTTTVAGRFNFRNLANAAEFEREMIHQRTQVGRNAAARELKWLNDHPPLGYDIGDDQRLVPNDEEAELVERIFRRYIELRSMEKVARELNAEGVSTKKGKEWTARAVGDILRNEIYIGVYSFANVEEYVEDYQLIEDDLFEQVTEVRLRFQSNEPVTREAMERERKQEYVGNIVESYVEYLDENGLVH